MSEPKVVPLHWCGDNTGRSLDDTVFFKGRWISTSKRLVASWNACADIPTEDLENAKPGDVVVKR